MKLEDALYAIALSIACHVLALAVILAVDAVEHRELHPDNGVNVESQL